MTFDEKIGAQASLSHGNHFETALARAEDMESAAEIYVASFPQIVRRFFSDFARARTFYHDLFDLMRLAFGETFYVMRDEHGLAAYLILSLPGRPVLAASLRDGFLWRAAIHALQGKYGLSPASLGRAVSALLGFGRSAPAAGPVDAPHIYVIAVAPEHRRRGTGGIIFAILLEKARRACLGKYNRIWLYVEKENEDLIRYYQRRGFQLLGSEPTRHSMIWELNTARGRK